MSAIARCQHRAREHAVVPGQHRVHPPHQWIGGEDEVREIVYGAT
jgi:hypothetical protein